MCTGPLVEEVGVNDMISPGSLIYFESEVLVWVAPNYSTKSLRNFWDDDVPLLARRREPSGSTAHPVFMPPLEMLVVIEYLKPMGHSGQSYIKGLHPSHGIVFVRTNQTVVLYKPEEL